MKIRYTARAGGGALRNRAVDEVKAAIASATALGSTRLFSMRHEFPGEWARFQAQTGPRFELAIALRAEHFPFWGRDRLKTVDAVRIVAESSLKAVPSSIDVFDKPTDIPAAAARDSLTKDPGLGNLLAGPLEAIPRPAAPTGDLKLCFATKDLKDVWLAVTWSGTA
jgi:hypothetical protein